MTELADEAGRTSSEPPRGEGAEGFAAWFAKNYPGPNTIISDPNWHAPRIYRAAMYHAQSKAATDAQVDDLAAALNQCADDLLDEDGPSSFSIAERLYDLAAFHVPAHPAPSQAVVAVDAEPEQAVGDGVVAHRYFDPDMPGSHTEWKDGQPKLSDAQLTARGYGVERAYGTPRPAVATAAEVTEEMVDSAAKGMWDSVPRGVEWTEVQETTAENWRFLARAALSAVLTTQPATTVATAGDGVTDEQVREWCERHDIFSLGSHLTDARAAFEDAQSLASPSAPRVAVPEGWKLVPVEPTPKMIDATFDDPIETNGQCESHNTRNRRVYKAMLAAAPEVSRG